jgi:hypothetical protein
LGEYVNVVEVNVAAVKEDDHDPHIEILKAPTPPLDQESNAIAERLVGLTDLLRNGSVSLVKDSCSLIQFWYYYLGRAATWVSGPWFILRHAVEGQELEFMHQMLTCIKESWKAEAHFRCVDCPFSLFKLSVVKTHLGKAHVQAARLACEHCDYTCLSKSGMYKHRL